MPRKPITPELAPISNLSEEKEKFFKSKTYNPQFEYKTPINPFDLLRYGTPSNSVHEYAQYMIEKLLRDYGSLDEILNLEGNITSFSETKRLFDEYLSSNNAASLVKILYLEDQVVRTNTSLTSNNEIVMKIRLPISYREKSIEAVLDHEIGTHVFRWANDMRQPWYDNPIREDFADYLETEEGLATLHGLLAHPLKIPLTQAIYYHAVFLAQTLSFRELFEKLNSLFNDTEYSWLLALRVKRGYKNTEEPGAYTKDVVYLNGAKKVSIWLSQNNYKADKLYLGKIALEDITRVANIESHLSPLLPLFVTDQSYSDRIGRIISNNEFLTL